MLTISLADQHPIRTKSQGIYNISVGLVRELDRMLGGEVSVLSNPEVSQDLDKLGVMAQKTDFRFANDGSWGRVLWDQWWAYRVAKKEKAGLLILPKGFLSFAKRPPVRTVAYIHDVMLAYYEKKYPRHFSWFERWYFKESLRATVRFADYIVTNTEFSRQEIFAWMREEGLPMREVYVVGYGFSDVGEVGGEGRDAVVLMLQSAPHKLCKSILQMLERLGGGVTTVGNAPKGVPLPEGNGWKHHGRVHPSQMQGILASAKVLIYSSEYEGFGMPPVEAVLAGVVPVYSDIPPLREVMGEAGYAYTNGDVDSLRRALDLAQNTPSRVVQEWRETLMQRHSFASVADKIFKITK